MLARRPRTKYDLPPDWMRQVLRDSLRQVLVWIAEGRMRVPVCGTYEFDDVQKAVAVLFHRRAIGKVSILIGFWSLELHLAYNSVGQCAMISSSERMFATGAAYSQREISSKPLLQDVRASPDGGGGAVACCQVVVAMYCGQEPASTLMRPVSHHPAPQQDRTVLKHREGSRITCHWFQQDWQSQNSMMYRSRSLAMPCSSKAEKSYGAFLSVNTIP